MPATQADQPPEGEAPSTTAPIPPCFEPGEWVGWLEAAQITDLRAPESHFCWDCNPIHQARMQAAGRCTRPNTIFALVTSKNPDEDSALCGLTPSQHRALKAYKRIADG